MVAPRNSEHIRYKLGCNRCTRLVLLVHASIGIAWNDSGDAASRSGLARLDEDQKLHQAVVHVPAATLNDEDILLSDGLADLHARLAIREFLHHARG